MQLKLVRSRRESAFTKTVIFCVDARAELTPEEQENVNRYKLGSQVIYNSEASKRQLAKGNAAGDGSFTGSLKQLGYIALAMTNLNITINGLQRGQHIECKDLDEVLGAEDALMTACKQLKVYLDIAATFDGREALFDFASGEPVLAAPSAHPPPQLAAPSASESITFHHETAPEAVIAGGTAATTTLLSDWAGHNNDAPSMFDDWMERGREWWHSATTGQKALTGGGVLLALYLLAHLL